MKYQGKIDFQAHYLPKAYYDFLEEEGLYCPDGFPTPEWDESWQQEAMGELGISSIPGINSAAESWQERSMSRALKSLRKHRGISVFSQRCRCPMSTVAFLRRGIVWMNCMQMAWD